jgi:hypothetical protein
MEALAKPLDNLPQIACVLLDDFPNLGRGRHFGFRLRFLTLAWRVFGRVHVRTVGETETDPLSQVKQSNLKELTFSNGLGDVILSPATNAVGLVEEVFAIAHRLLSVLVYRNRDRLDVLVTPPFPRC